MELREVSLCAQLACALEVACPKPGNVNRYHDFEDTTLEHYLASAVAIGGAASKAARAGFKHGAGEPSIRIGRLILEAVQESKRWHSGRNTNLGLALLLLPLAASYGAALRTSPQPGDTLVRDSLDAIMRSTTPEDALCFYRAVREAAPGGLGRGRELDVWDKGSDDRIISEGITLYKVLCMSQGDSIAKELVSRMRVTFEIGYPSIFKVYKETGSLRRGILYGYMRILSASPDSLIARKKGWEVARRVSRRAAKILRAGLPAKELEEFDRRLRTRGNTLNPGATADLTAASLMVCLLKGARP
jgi:triphosphoribosyl-dephospho-CoA synthase